MNMPVYLLNGKETTHRELYLWLASPERLDTVNEAVKIAGYLGNWIPVPMQLIQGAPLPYFLFPIAKNHDYEAHCGGIYLKITSPLFPEASCNTPYYLPVIGMCESAGDQVLQHELEHLADLLDLIEADPAYPGRALAHGLSSLRPDAGKDAILSCIDFEVARIEKIELKAAISEFRHGERSIPFQFLFWQLPYPCCTQEDYVETMMALYVEKREKAVVKKYPDFEPFIRASFRSAVDREFASLTAGQVPSEVFSARAKAFYTWVEANMPKFSRKE